MVMIVVQSFTHCDPCDKPIVECHNRREIFVSPCVAPTVDQVVKEEHIQQHMRPRDDEHRPKTEYIPKNRDSGQ